MTIPKVKSRVQFQCRAKQRGKNNKHRPEKSNTKHTNNDAHGPTKAPKVYLFSVESDDPIYDDDSNPIDGDATTFFKQRVLTTDDQESDGAFKSGLRTALILVSVLVIADSRDVAGNGADEHAHKSSGACKTDHSTEPKDENAPSIPFSLDASGSITDEDSDPPNSLLMLEPLWWPREVLFREYPSSLAQKTTADSSPMAEEATAGPSQVTEETAVDKSLMVEETTAHTSPGETDATRDSSSTSTDTTADSLSEATVIVSTPSPVVVVTTAGPSPVAASTTTDPSSVSAAVPTNPPSATTVTTAGPPPATATAPATTIAPVTTIVPATTASPVTTVVVVTAVPIAKRAPVVVQSTAKLSLGPWHQWFVTLFAGRKAVPTNINDSTSPHQAASAQPVSIISWARARSDSDSEPEIAAPPSPRIDLPKILPETRDKMMRIANRPGYHIVMPPGQHDQYAGYAVMKGDAYDADKVQRGFIVPSHPHLAPLPQRRMNSNISLLDREGNTWAEWNKLNLTAESMPFTRSRSDTQLLHPQTGDTMGRNTTRFRPGQTKGQTGHSFLEDVGHRYPFGQGLGW